MDMYTIVGLAGVAGYVTSYALLQLGLLDGNGALYSVANVVAAALVLVSLSSDFNLAAAVIQITWIVIGAVGLSLRVLRHVRVATPTVVATEARQIQALRSALEDAEVERASPFRAAGHPAG